jgi:hypothetical protein
MSIVTLMNWYLPVPTDQVKRQLPHQFCQGIKNQVHVQEWVTVLFHDLIQGSIIDTETGSPILLHHQDNW